MPRFDENETIVTSSESGLPYDTVKIPLSDLCEVTIIPRRNVKNTFEAILWGPNDRELMSNFFLKPEDVAKFLSAARTFILDHKELI